MNTKRFDLTASDPIFPFQLKWDPSLCISLYLSVSHFISLYLTLSLCISLYLSVSHFISLYLTLSLCISLYLSVSHFISLYLTLSLCISLYLSVSHYLKTDSKWIRYHVICDVALLAVYIKCMIFFQVFI